MILRKFCHASHDVFKQLCIQAYTRGASQIAVPALTDYCPKTDLPKQASRHKNAPQNNGTAKPPKRTGIAGQSLEQSVRRPVLHHKQGAAYLTCQKRRRLAYAASPKAKGIAKPPKK